MGATRFWPVVLFVGLAPVLPSGLAAAKSGHGGGGGGHGGGGGSSTLPVVLTFRDCVGGGPSADFARLHPGVVPEQLCPVTDDRFMSDGYPYEDGLDSVDAFIALSGSYGALGLRLAKSARGFFLDFTDCAGAPGTCNPPFDAQLVWSGQEGIDVDANVVEQNGLLGMAVGETIATPLRITYGDFGFVNFNPALRGKDPCKNKSNYVSATRTSDTSWEITADANAVGCMTLPGGAFGGTYKMPFQFTVTQK